MEKWGRECRYLVRYCLSFCDFRDFWGMFFRMSGFARAICGEVMCGFGAAGRKMVV